MSARIFAAVAVVVALLLLAAACPENRARHGTVHCYADEGRQTEIPCDFGHSS
jgi:hypothetical protein